MRESWSPLLPGENKAVPDWELLVTGSGWWGEEMHV